MQCHFHFTITLGCCIAAATNKIHFKLKIELSDQIGKKNKGALEHTEQKRVLTFIVISDEICQTLYGEGYRPAAYEEFEIRAVDHRRIIILEAHGVYVIEHGDFIYNGI